MKDDDYNPDTVMPLRMQRILIAEVAICVMTLTLHEDQLMSRMSDTNLSFLTEENIEIS